MLLPFVGSMWWIGAIEAKSRVYVVSWRDEAFAVVSHGQTLLTVRYPEEKKAREERAEEIARRLNRLFEYPFREPPTFRVEKKKDRVEAYCGEQLLFSVFREEALYNCSDPLNLALLWLNRIQMEFYRISERGITSSTIEGMASWCNIRFHGRRTALGEEHDAYAFTAAHRELPFGSVVLVTSLETGKRVIVRINDRGPWKRGRLVDLSLAAAKVLGIQRDGVERVRLEVIPWKR